jgi:hypothetical protein
MEILHLPTDDEPENYEPTSFELCFICKYGVTKGRNLGLQPVCCENQWQNITVIEQGNCVETSSLHVADSRDTAVAFAILSRQSSERHILPLITFVF